MSSGGLRTSLLSAPVGYMYEISRESLGCGKEKPCVDRDVSAEFLLTLSSQL